MKTKHKKKSLEAENRLREFFVWWILMFLMRTLIWRSQKNEILAKSGWKWLKTFSILFYIFVFDHDLANLYQNPCFFIWFFIVDGQKNHITNKEKLDLEVPRLNIHLARRWPSVGGIIGGTLDIQMKLLVWMLVMLFDHQV